MGDWRCSSVILDFGTRWSLLVNFMLLALYPGEFVPIIHWKEDLVDPIADLNAVEKKILPLPGTELQPSSP
jgi:hypothetical protein